MWILSYTFPYRCPDKTTYYFRFEGSSFWIIFYIELSLITYYRPFINSVWKRTFDNRIKYLHMYTYGYTNK